MLTLDSLHRMMDQRGQAMSARSYTLGLLANLRQLTVIYKMHVHANKHILPSLCRPRLILPVLPQAPLGIGGLGWS